LEKAIGNALLEVTKQSKEIATSARLLADKLAERISESAEKSVVPIIDELPKRQKQIYEDWSSL
jgi:F0F1-type ATP synthase membrane subunit b/b'